MPNRPEPNRPVRRPSSAIRAAVLAALAAAVPGAACTMESDYGLPDRDYAEESVEETGSDAANETVGDVPDAEAEAEAAVGAYAAPLPER